MSWSYANAEDALALTHTALIAVWGYLGARSDAGGIYATYASYVWCYSTRLRLLRLTTRMNHLGPASDVASLFLRRCSCHANSIVNVIFHLPFVQNEMERRRGGFGALFSGKLLLYSCQISSFTGARFRGLAQPSAAPSLADSEEIGACLAFVHV